MCLAVMHLENSSRFPIVCLTNRDEFHHRPTAPLQKWLQSPIYAGIDRQSGGTWLGITESGRFALLTNVRDSKLNKPEPAPSRGNLVSQFLLKEELPSTDNAQTYSGFNLIAGNLLNRQLKYLSNQSQGPAIALSQGVHGLSNKALDTPWPKTEWLKKASNQVLKSHGLEEPWMLAERMLALLQHTELADDKDLPNTGVPYEWEKMLSAVKIVSPVYGTRASTVVIVDSNNRLWMVERSFLPSGESSAQDVRISLQLKSNQTS